MVKLNLEKIALELRIVESSLRNLRINVLRSKRDGLAEIEERALALRETAKAKDRVAKNLEAAVTVMKDGKKRFNADVVSPSSAF